MAHTATTHPKVAQLTLPWRQTLRGLHWPGKQGRILLLHEPGTDLDAWGTLAATLAQEFSADVYAYDLPGHGLSDDPWQPEQLPDVTREVIADMVADDPICVVAAGSCATTTLHLASEMPLFGLVSLSPDEPAAPTPRSPVVPKLFFAGAQGENDLSIARRLAAACGGWALVASIPLSTRGTALLTTDWSPNITEQTISFLSDCVLRHTRSQTPLSP